MKRPELTEKSIKTLADIAQCQYQNDVNIDLIIEDALEMYSDYLERMDKLIR